MERPEEAKEDWDRQITMTVEAFNTKSVNLRQGGVKMVDRLRFLGHLPAVLDTISPGQTFSPPVFLSSAAYLCQDYDQISPDSNIALL